jgi:hypothetical protein
MEVVTDQELEKLAAGRADADAVLSWAVDLIRDGLAPLADDFPGIEVLPHGSFANGTAVDRHSDIDLIAWWPGAVVRGVVGWGDPESARYQDLRRSVLSSLREHVDPGVPEPNVACRCEFEGYMIDVVPCLPYRPRAEAGRDDIWFWQSAYMVGPTVSWPSTISALIEDRDAEADGGFRPVVRALKGIRDERLGARDDKVAGFVVESLAYAAGADAVRAGTVRERCRAVLEAVIVDVLDETRARLLTDPSARAPLFAEPLGRPSPALDRAQAFVEDAWHRLA